MRLSRTQRGDLLCFSLPFVLYAVNEQIKYRVSAPVVGYLLRCHVNDYLGGVAFAAYLNLIVSLSRWPDRRLYRPTDRCILWRRGCCAACSGRA